MPNCTTRSLELAWAPSLLAMITQRGEANDVKAAPQRSPCLLFGPQARTVSTGPQCAQPLCTGPAVNAVGRAAPHLEALGELLSEDVHEPPALLAQLLLVLRRLLGCLLHHGIGADGKTLEGTAASGGSGRARGGSTSRRWEASPLVARSTPAVVSGHWPGCHATCEPVSTCRPGVMHC